MVPRGRIELPTLRSSGERSTNELPRHYLVGILGIEPSVGFPDGFTVRSRTLRGDAQILYSLIIACNTAELIAERMGS
jgi:hypothetical protein